MKVIVAQIGARHRYLIPKVLNDSGLLSFLYTDTTSDSFVGRIASVINIFFKTKKISRLISRKTKLPKNKVKSSDRIFFKSLIQKGNKNKIYSKLQGLSGKMINWGVSDSGVLYNMFIENLDFVEYSKSKGLKIYSDIYESITTYEDMVLELKNFKTIDVSTKYLKIYKELRDLRRPLIPRLIENTDIFVVPSNFVKEGLIKSFKIEKNKIKLVPYGNSISFKKRNNGIFGQLLWVGNDPFRKGLTYLIQAFNILKLTFPNIELRVAGITDSEVINDPYFKGTTFLGKLSRNELTKEYLNADIFVLPTISEGLVGVVIEAAAAGCPVITTPNSGIDLETFPGLVCEPRNVNQLKDSIELLLINRSKRESISEEIMEYAKMFSVEGYKSRLLNLFN